MKEKFCSEDDRSSFKLLQTVFTLFLVISGVGMGIFIYFLVAATLEYENVSGVTIYQLDNSTPPYMGIIIVVVFIVSWIGLRHVSKLEKSLC